MAEPEKGANTPSGDGHGAAAVELRGLGFGLTAAALRLLLDPATRGQAEVVVDLSAMSVRVPAAVVHELARRVAPEVALGLGEDGVTVRLPESPAIRIMLPAAGVRVGVDADGLQIDRDGSAGDGRG